MGTTPLVELQDVSLRHGSVLVLDRVTLQVEPGSIHALVGPNGAGKTSVLKAILGQNEFEGTIRCHWRQGGRIGYVPQTLDIDRDLPVQVVQFLLLRRQKRPVSLGQSRVPRTEVLEALEKVGMADRGERRLGALSGGELQRVLLAGALLPKPELLLLDEATAGVDDEGLRRTEEVLLALKRDAVTTLLVSHDFAHTARIADQATALQGSVKATGRPADVLATLRGGH
jgi:zinc transport system ATP-binding protein